jgi:hypothetical protein
MSLTGKCKCPDANWIYPHFATPKAKCIHCDTWISWTIDRIKDHS